MKGEILKEDEYRHIEERARNKMREWERSYVPQDINIRHSFDFWVAQETALFMAERNRTEIWNMRGALVQVGMLVVEGKTKEEILPIINEIINDHAPPHIDDVGVDKFAEAMKAKLAEKRKDGYSGWHDPEDCTPGFLSQLLIDHVEKGDPVDVANICMFLFTRGWQIGDMT